MSQTAYTLIRTAAAARRETRRRFGVSSLVSSSRKTLKSLGVDVETLVIYLPAAKRINGESCCPASTPTCRRTCLGYHSGRMVMSNVRRAQRARVPIVAEMLRDPDAIGWEILAGEIRTAMARAKRLGRILAVRLNGTSDLDWPATEGYQRIRAQFPDLVWYDYTKRRDLLCVDGHHWTFSATENTADATIRTVVRSGINVAVVFRGPELPQEYLGFPVLNGDTDDARFLDDPGHIVGLTAKGSPAKRDRSGFTRDA